MQATPEQLVSLDELQEIDRSMLQSKMQIQELPQRKAIEQTRAKRSELAKKTEQIDKLFRNAESELNGLVEEDELQSQRQKATQQKIDEAQGDYRAVTSLTRDLEGMTKRRETLDFEMGKADKSLEQVSAVRKQAAQAAAALEKREMKLMEEYGAAIDQLKAQVEKSLADRKDIQADIPANILKAYEDAKRKCGGVGVAHLQEDRCGACRSTIEPNRLLQIKRDAPIATCPSCGRLLIIE